MKSENNSLKKTLNVLCIATIVIAVCIFFFANDDSSKNDHRESDKNQVVDHKIKDEVYSFSRHNDKVDKQKVRVIKRNNRSLQEICQLIPKLSSLTLDELLQKFTEEQKNKRTKLDIYLKLLTGQKVQGNSEVALFFKALAKAGLLKSQYKVNHLQSQKIFLKLQNIEPQNGAYYFFNLVNLKEDERKSEIKKMIQTSYFDFHLSKVFIMTRDESLNDVGLFFLGQEVLSRIPYPDFKRARNIIAGQLTELEDKHKASDYFELIIKQNLESEGKYIELSWSPMVLMIFRSLYKEVLTFVNKEGTDYPSYQELIKQDYIRSKRNNNRVELENLRKHCLPGDADYLFQQENKTFLDFKRVYPGT